jgi:hypothetical protein
MVMRLADIIKQCKDAGCSEVELHPDGSIARMVFGPVVERKRLTRAEEIEKARKERNPRRDAMELTDAILRDRNPEANQ